MRLAAIKHTAGKHQVPNNTVHGQPFPLKTMHAFQRDALQ